VRSQRAGCGGRGLDATMAQDAVESALNGDSLIGRQPAVLRMKRKTPSELRVMTPLFPSNFKFRMITVLPLGTCSRMKSLAKCRCRLNIFLDRWLIGYITSYSAVHSIPHLLTIYEFNVMKMIYLV